MSDALNKTTVEEAPGFASAFRRNVTYAFSDGTPRCSMQVALVVGTILNAINQGDALLGGGPVVWWKLVLTYCVPYFVCTYGAVTSRLRSEGR